MVLLLIESSQSWNIVSNLVWPAGSTRHSISITRQDEKVTGHTTPVLEKDTAEMDEQSGTGKNTEARP